LNTRIVILVSSLALVLAAPVLAQGPGATGAGAHARSGQPLIAGVVHADIAGVTLPTYPHFTCERAFFEGDDVWAGLDPTAHPGVVGRTCDVYVVAHKSEVQWAQNPQLFDVRGAPQTFTFSGGNVESNLLLLTSTLSGNAGTGLGVPYDVVLDFDRNGNLSSGDWIDGSDAEAGFYVLYPTTQPGPLAVTEVIYSGGTWLGQDLYYPTNIANLGSLPLVTVSHGNGHNYTWYDHIGYHLASYGCIVMSHTNNTMPGIEAASTTTLSNNEYLLSNLATIAGGVLQGHLDNHRIIWFGHSRGGEGVARAYDRIFDGSYVPQNFQLSDIILVSSIAPTDFLGTASSNPHAVNYSLWTGGADNDVNGCADCDLCQTFHLHERAIGNHQSISLHGVGHGAFHDGGGDLVATGPCIMSREDTHQIMRSYMLPLVKVYAEGNIPGRDCLWRQWETFHSPGSPTTICAVVDLMYEEAPQSGKFVIDDFQTQPSTTISSSGGAVDFDVSNVTEGLFNDVNTDFTNNASDPMNGMTFATGSDSSKGLVFDWNGVDTHLSFQVVPGAQDVTQYGWLSFRACQATRHPYTIAQLGDLDFHVRLRDASSGSSTIAISTYGGGIEEPYQRTSCGIGAGWGNEFETIRIRLSDFTRDGAPIDLTHVAWVDFLFGPSNGAAQGRLGFDDVELERD
jgi:hypothetical protein